MLRTSTPFSPYQGKAISQVGNVINGDWPTAQRLHAHKLRMEETNKPLKSHQPIELAKLQGFDGDDNGPEAA